MLSVNEKSPVFITIVFTDQDGNPLTPTTADWRIDDVVSGTQIKDWTNIPTPTDTEQVTIPATDNVLIDATVVREIKAIGVRVNVGLPAEAHAEMQYAVLNLVDGI